MANTTKNNRCDSHRRHPRRKTIRRMAASVAFVVCLLVLTMNTNALSLSMVASSTFGRRSSRSILRTPPSTLDRPTSGGGVTSSLVSQLAVVALKLRLQSQSAVKCDVTASSSDLLLKGKLGPVTVRGREWQSKLGLTCRAIEATVDSCDLDIGRVLSQQKLVLKTPARGNAMVALNSVDFGNFITHPLMKPPGLMEGDDAGIQFLREGVSIDVKTGVVSFLGSYVGEMWRCTLQRGSSSDDKALVTVEPTSENEENQSTASKLTRLISKFFNEMVFNLDGTFLTFNDIMVTAKGGEPSVMLALHIKVKKFPSPGLAF